MSWAVPRLEGAEQATMLGLRASWIVAPVASAAPCPRHDAGELPQGIYVSALERCVYAASIDVVARLAAVLEAEAADLLRWPPRPDRAKRAATLQPGRTAPTRR